MIKNIFLVRVCVLFLPGRRILLFLRCNFSFDFNEQEIVDIKRTLGTFFFTFEGN